jgi:hypothetical protein
MAIGIGVAILMVVAVAQLVAVIASQRRIAEQTRLATREAANAMEHLLSVSWTELNPDAPPEVTVSAAAADRLDDPRLSVAITAGEADVSVKQIDVRIDWLNRGGQRGDPVRLVAWRHAAARADREPPEDSQPAE